MLAPPTTTIVNLTGTELCFFTSRPDDLLSDSLLDGCIFQNFKQAFPPVALKVVETSVCSAAEINRAVMFAHLKASPTFSGGEPE